MADFLKSKFIQFYCLDYSDLFLLLVVMTGCFLMLNKKYTDKPCWKVCLYAALLAWITLVLYSTVASRSSVEIGQGNLIPFHSYREVKNGGNPEIYRSNLMNVVLFYPNGLLAAVLLPNKWPKKRKVLLVTMCFLLISAGIEWVQYRYQLGHVEIDDMIHNTTGALLGSLAALIPVDKFRAIPVSE